MAPNEPAVSIERERKYDVETHAALPALGELSGAAAVEGPSVRELDARYFDSAELHLARAQVALRRREGGPDEGWHIKGPKLPDGGRREFQWPLGDAEAGVPPHVAEVIARWSGDAPMLPLARLRNTRTVWNIRDAAGAVIIEFVDDHVTGFDLRGGGERSWREWEAELGPAAPNDDTGRDALFAEVDQLVVAAGGRVSASSSKLARALGAEDSPQ